MDPEPRLFMNRRAIEAIDYRLQVVDAMQKNGGLDVPSIGNVATDGGKFERLLCAIEFQKKNGVRGDALFCRPRDQVKTLSLLPPRQILQKSELCARGRRWTSGTKDVVDVYHDRILLNFDFPFERPIGSNVAALAVARRFVNEPASPDWHETASFAPPDQGVSMLLNRQPRGEPPPCRDQPQNVAEMIP
jgi:hypothetical protein